MAQKKSFKANFTNPAMQFISTPSQETAERTIIHAPKTIDSPKEHKVNPHYIETKSKRLQLLLQPSLLEKLRNRAKTEGRSVNDLVHSILEYSINN